jgi:hypothetical protein
MDWILDNGAGVSRGSGASNSATDQNEVATDWMDYQMAKSVVPISMFNSYALLMVSRSVSQTPWNILAG